MGNAIQREPYHPPAEAWAECWQMLCGHCRHWIGFAVVERMIEMKDGGPWPEGGWVTDPGAGITCLSYDPKEAQPLSRQAIRQIARSPETRLPPVCAGCAARAGSEASVSLHTQRDFRAAVKRRSKFLCHETGNLCGGWCRAVAARRPRKDGGR